MPYLTVQFETNGDIIKGMESIAQNLPFRSHVPIFLEFVISPKFTTPEQAANYDKKVAKIVDSVIYNTTIAKLYWKFLFDKDCPIYSAPPVITHRYSQYVSFYLSPVNKMKRQLNPGEVASMWDSTLYDHEFARENYKAAAIRAAELGYKLSLQTHLFLSVE
jgi:hypothetical protein